MKKDLQSYAKHNSEYLETWNDYEHNKKVIEKYDVHDTFKSLGFEYALRLSNPLPATHIDIGSGNGWLVRKMSPLFKHTIGIEPSEAIIEVAKEINKNNTNASFIQADMIDGLRTLNIKEPVFITTATVLNHIDNKYVAEFLSVVNNLPHDSVLFFDERYDTNIDWNMWHVRSKDWWIKNLPQWQLFFLNIQNNSYASGIYGICVGEENIITSHSMTKTERFFWHLEGYINILYRVYNKARRILRM